MKQTVRTIFKAVAVAMGIAVVVLSLLNTFPPSTGLLLLGIGVAGLGIASLQN
jgi:hypothetical protein